MQQVEELLGQEAGLVGLLDQLGGGEDEIGPYTVCQIVAMDLQRRRYWVCHVVYGLFAGSIQHHSAGHGHVVGGRGALSGSFC